MDYFEFFGVQQAFQLDLNELRKKFYEKTKTIHPDFHAADKEDKMVLSAYNNQAYQILVDPLSRLKYIIESSTGPIQENHALLSQDFLMDMMDLHEQVNEAVVNADSILLESFKSQLNSLEDRAMKDAEAEISAYDKGQRSAQIFNGLTIYYFKLKYFKRLKQALDGTSIEL